MSSSVNNCPVWPSTPPYNGGPYPPRLWSRGRGYTINPINTGFSNQALNMRRKAEVLKHTQNKSQLSKKQILAQSLRGGPRLRKKSILGANPLPGCNGNTILHSSTSVMSEQNIIYNPASASDVPGQELLWYNPKVPLVGYKRQLQYLAEGTKWPQTKSGEIIVQQNDDSSVTLV